MPITGPQLRTLEYKDLKKLSVLRIKEAKVLFDNKKYSGAYYLAGYSIELALKALWCKNVPEKSFVPDKKIYNKVYTHNLNDLLSVSGIKGRLLTNLSRESNWSVVKDWSEKTRYQIVPKNDAKYLYDAITAPRDGILTRIKKLW
jgi:HEPN domain-containing protein